VVPDAVEIETPAVDCTALLADLKRALVAFEPAEILRERDFAAMVEDTKDLYAELREILSGFKPEDADFAGVYSAVREFLGKAPETFRQADSMSNGTLSALPRIGMFFGYRVAAGEIRRALFDAFMRETRKVIDQMEKETLVLFERLAKDAVRETGETADAA